MHTDQPLISSSPQTGCHQDDAETSLLPPSQGADLQLQHAAELSQRGPRAAMQDEVIAGLFSHYINTLAPWYDLNDADATFRIVVPDRALSFPLLFRAIIAFSSMHWSRSTGKLRHIAFAFHAACVNDLLGAVGDCPDYPSELLAASVLLRLYEVLGENMENPECHLLGGYSFSTTMPMDLSSWGLSQASYWNFLRQELTVSLTYNRHVRVAKDLPELHSLITHSSTGDDMRANLITYILARAINLFRAFTEEPTGDKDLEYNLKCWGDLSSALALWRDHLPSTLKPFSTAHKPNNGFPSEWMLSPWSVSALQYALTAEVLLALCSDFGHQRGTERPPHDQIQTLTLQICGLAYTNEYQEARVNSFGPLSFCGRFLTEYRHQAALEAMLVDFGEETAWPVQFIITELKKRWSQDEQD
ncbi:hypothetical protein AK830_g11156 [Neonectria ditissima]|uniref:Transcription factor domain-containing protein n=1 Tax=Neonectria ditissima TaxID=78410 RepID=A0A0P7B222_9HYPO|nr:hypothetical protein AK830_g11156 [Neonectria ditissima]